MTGDPSGGPGLAEFAGLGMRCAVCLLAGLGLGWLVDTLAGTLPIFLMIGLVAGMVLGVFAFRAEVRRW